MLYETITRDFELGEIRVFTEGNSVNILNRKKLLKIMPGRILGTGPDGLEGEVFEKKVTPSELLYFCACLRLASRMRHSFTYEIKPGLKLRYRNHRFKVIFLDEEDRVQEVYLVYRDFEDEPKGDVSVTSVRWLLPVFVLKIIVDIENMISDRVLEIGDTNGNIKLLANSMHIINNMGTISVPYEDLFLPALIVFLGAPLSFVNEVAVGDLLFYRTDEDIYISRKGEVLYSGSVFDSLALLSGLKSKLLPRYDISVR